MKKILTFEFDDDDCKLHANAHIRGPDLALCIWSMKERIGREWEECDEDSPMEKLIDDIGRIVEDTIGNIEDYTE